MKFKTLIIGILLVSWNALSETAIIVHPSNNSEIDIELVKKIYTGKVIEFPDGQVVNAINFSQKNTLRVNFDESFLNRQTSQIQALWAKLVFTGKGTPPKEVNSNEEVLAIVAADISAIGYIDASKADSSVKIITKY